MEQYFPKLSESSARWLRFGVLVSGLLLSLWLMYQLRAVFTPIFAALAIAYILNPVVGWFERRGVRRLLTVIAVYVLTATVAITALVVLGTQTLVQLNELQNRLPGYIEQISQQAEQFQQRIELGWLVDVRGALDSQPDDATGSLATAPAAAGPLPGDTRSRAAAEPDPGGPAAGSARIDPAAQPAGDDADAAWTATPPAATQPVATQPAATQPAAPLATTQPAATQPAAPRLWATLRPWVMQYAADWANDGWARASNFIGGLVSLLSLAVLIPMYTFFFLWRFDHMMRVFYAHLPAGPRPAIVRILTTIDQAIANFFRGRLTTCLLVGTLNGVGWLLVGVQFSLVLGVLAGVLNLVPFMGVLALPPALLFAYLGAVELGVPWFWPVVLAFAVFMFVQSLEAFIFSPVFEGSSVGLHPITTVIALLIGAQVAGALGMLLAIPVASTIKTLSVEWLLPEVRRLAAEPGRPPAGASGPAAPVSRDD